MAESKSRRQESRLHSLDIKTKDLKKSCDFYSNVLGLMSIVSMGCVSQGYVLSRNNYLNVEIEHENNEVNDTLVPWVQFEDVQEIYRRCEDAGVEIVMPLTEQPDGNLIAKVRDPDGNMIGISQLGKGPPTIADMLDRANVNEEEKNE